MKVSIAHSHAPGRLDLILRDVRYSSFTEHDLRDLEFALAQRRAMTARCGQEHGEHTCALRIAHNDAKIVVHMCRGCDVLWDPDGQEWRPGQRAGAPG